MPVQAIEKTEVNRLVQVLNLKDLFQELQNEGVTAGIEMLKEEGQQSQEWVSKLNEIYSSDSMQEFFRNELLKLGYDCPEIYGDIGLLLSKFYNPSVVKKYKLGIIPHFSEYEKCVTLFGNMKNVLVIDLCRDIEPVIDDILSCEQTMSSSLHGIIESHAYGISCCWFMFNDTEQKLGGGKFKFKDYYSSVSEKEFEPVILADKGYSLNELVNICTPYVNPKFPIKIDDIINSCPF